MVGRCLYGSSGLQFVVRFPCDPAVFVMSSAGGVVSLLSSVSGVLLMTAPVSPVELCASGAIEK